jgi:hypothetical protein
VDVSVASEQLPRALFVGGVLSSHTWRKHGMHADVYHGTYGHDFVAIKRLRPNTNEETSVFRASCVTLLHALHAHIF